VPRDREKWLRVCYRRFVEDWRTENQANRAYEAWRARGIADGSRRMASGATKPYEPPAEPKGKINTTDPDSKNMKVYRGYVQGYNAQTVTTRDQIIVAAEIAPTGSTSPSSTRWSPPQNKRTRLACASRGISRLRAEVLGDRAATAPSGDALRPAFELINEA
jgi:hypothetical protein